MSDGPRHRTDPLADDAIAVLDKPRPGEDILQRVRDGARSGNAALQRFLDETHVMPPWFFARDLVAGRRAALRHAPLTFLVLLTGSLIESFAIAEGAAVLVRTGRLLRDTRPRIYETASLVRDVLLHGAELPGRRAHTSLLRVRLLHAAVRRFVVRTPGWDDARYGKPVNQMDMQHTLLMFSHVVARGTSALGGRFTEDERASWCALWRTCGWLLGVEASLLPTDVAAEERAYAAIRTHYAPNDDSRALAHAVLDALADQPPFFLSRTALDALARAQLGERLADSFALRSGARSLPRALAVGWRAKDVVERLLPFGTRVAALGGRAFIEINRRRILRDLPEADYAFRTAPDRS